MSSLCTELQKCSPDCCGGRGGGGSRTFEPWGPKLMMAARCRGAVRSFVKLNSRTHGSHRASSWKIPLNSMDGKRKRHSKKKAEEEEDERERMTWGLFFSPRCFRGIKVFRVKPCNLSGGTHWKQWMYFYKKKNVIVDLQSLPKFCNLIFLTKINLKKKYTYINFCVTWCFL